MTNLVRSAECGMRNSNGSDARRPTFHWNSALRIPHSALGVVGLRCG
jgi:hypothetical protein